MKSLSSLNPTPCSSLSRNPINLATTTDYQFPKDALGRHFSHELYIRVLANKETLDRRWLVYSEAFDKAFCFCCKLFRDDDDDDQKRDDDLVTRGYNDWGNFSTRFREHETSYDHIRCMVRWREVNKREKGC